MLSMALQPSFRAIETSAFNYPSFNKICLSKLPITKNQVFAIPFNPFCLFSQTHFRKEKKIKVSASADVASLEEEATAEDSQPQIEKLGVVVKPMSKPRLVLKFIWMEKNIGLGLDQVIPGHGSIPLSPYYFWPRKDAWEELKVLLETKPWISQKQMIILLNQATDIINLWQQSGGDLS